MSLRRILRIPATPQLNNTRPPNNLHSNSSNQLHNNRSIALASSHNLRNPRLSPNRNSQPQNNFHRLSTTCHARSYFSGSGQTDVHLSDASPAPKMSSEEPPSLRRQDWSSQQSSRELMVDTETFNSRLAHLTESFKSGITTALEEDKSTTFCLITAWLISDNIVIDLFHKLIKQHPHLKVDLQIIAINTLHLFPETIQLAKEMEEKYKLKIRWFSPQGCNSLEDFERTYGSFATLSESDFDAMTKIEPLQRALEDLQKERVGSQTDQAESAERRLVVVTGRRNDQGNERTDTRMWEKEKLTLNPVVNWTWNDVTLYAKKIEVPVNSLHRRIYVDPFNGFRGKKDRDDYGNFVELNLDIPYFHYKPEILRKMFQRAGPKQADEKMNFYVWKSFGDTVTSVPVTLDESEREGRFVHRQATECGIHTRVSMSKKAPHGGGQLVNLLTPDLQTPDPQTSPKLIEGVDYDSSIELNERQLCDLELLMNGGYSPLKGFMTESEYNSTVTHMRLPEASLWGLPIVLDTHDMSTKVGDRVLLRSTRMGGELAVMTVTSVWRPNKEVEAKEVYGTSSRDHPYVEYLMSTMGHVYIGGPITTGVKLPQRRWVRSERVMTPADLRERCKKFSEVIAFQCRNPLHRAHVEMFQKEKAGTKVVVHPSIGPSKQDDFNARIRVPTYEVLTKPLEAQEIDIFYFPYHMRLGGPRETLQHLICRKNYGFTQMIVGRDHAGCKDSEGNDFYSPYASQEIAEAHASELGIQPVSFKALVYVPDRQVYMPVEEAKEKGLVVHQISGTEFRRRIQNGTAVPEWYAFPEVVDLLCASFNYLPITDASRALDTARITGQPVALIEFCDSPPQALLDEVSALSSRFPVLPFYVLKSSTSRPSDPSNSRPSYSVISERPEHRIVITSFEEFQQHLENLYRGQLTP